MKVNKLNFKELINKQLKQHLIQKFKQYNVKILIIVDELLEKA